MKSMSSCKHATELVSKELDSELKIGQKLWLKTHLLMCRDCRECQRQMKLLEEACDIRRNIMKDLFD